MALLKEIELDNGITLNYHRIVSMTVITNLFNVIEVGSYTGENKRLQEKAALKNGESMKVFIESTYLNADYDPSMTIESAYEYLKTLPTFQGAEDLLENNDRRR